MRFAQALAIDALAVLVFAIIGRRSHAEADDLLGVAGTAGPFLAGLVLGYLLDAVRRGIGRVDARRHGPASLPTGITVWVCAVAAGMVLRVLAGLGGAPVSFVIVASISLGVLLLGWRGGLSVIRRARRGQRSRAPSA